MRHIIFLVDRVRIKFDHWRTSNDFVDNKCFSYKFDISQGYHHIGIDDNYQKYLGFSRKIDGKLI